MPRVDDDCSTPGPKETDKPTEKNTNSNTKIIKQNYNVVCQPAPEDANRASNIINMKVVFTFIIIEKKYQTWVIFCSFLGTWGFTPF